MRVEFSVGYAEALFEPRVLTHHTTGSASGTRRSRRHAQAGDPRPPGTGGAACTAASRVRGARSDVRQGKRFELEVEGPVDEAALARIQEMAETFLANTVIEDFVVKIEEVAATAGGSK